MRRKDYYAKGLIMDDTEFESIPVFILSLNAGKEAIIDADLEGKTPIAVEEQIESRLREGIRVELRVQAGSQGVNIYMGKISYVLRERIHIGGLVQVGNLQRRKEVKVRTKGDYLVWNYTVPVRNEEGLIEEEERPEINIALRDISAGGIGFITKGKNQDFLKEGQAYEMNFGEGNSGISLRFYLRWKATLPDGRINCGGQFFGLRTGEDMALRKFVFDCQRNERRLLMEEAEKEELLELQRQEIEERLAAAAKVREQKKAAESERITALVRAAKAARLAEAKKAAATEKEGKQEGK